MMLKAQIIVGKHGGTVGLSLHHAIPVEVCPTPTNNHTSSTMITMGPSCGSAYTWDQGHGPEFYPGRSAAIIPRVGVHRVTNKGIKHNY